MKKIRLRLYPVVFFLVPCIGLVNSCIKSDKTSFTDVPIVQACIEPGTHISVNVSRKTPYDESEKLSDLDINSFQMKIRFAGTWYSLVSAGNGRYTDTSGVIPVIADSSYSLSFDYNGLDVTSSTTVPLKPHGVSQSVTSVSMAQIDLDNFTWTKPPDPIEISFSNNDASYYFLTVECIEITRIPIYKDSIPSNDIMSTPPETGKTIYFNPRNIRYFGHNRIILYHITPEYANCFTQQESTTQNYQQPPTNIQNGLGFFTGINADTLFLNVVKTK
jgi:hypothetical protein